jgi:hypothetical protein
LKVCGFGPTATSKILFAVRPKSAIPWDAPIREAFGLSDDGDAYTAMLERCCEEARKLLEEAERHGIADIPREVARAEGRTLVRLLDEYHWITITEGHQVPDREELARWLSLAASRWTRN